VTARRSLRVGAVLSLTGRFARFGSQAARGLHTWSALTDHVEVVVEDDGGDQDRVRSGLGTLAQSCDLLLGPYSTRLMRAAGEFALEADRVIWNHGGAGDDVQTSAPGHVLSVLTPTSRYAEPFVRHLAGEPERAPLWLMAGRGSFARQVIDGAEAAALDLGVPVVRGALDDPRPAGCSWDLFTAGSFEEDTSLVSRALVRRPRPRRVGTVAAGVHEFGGAVPDADGVFGVAQWAPGPQPSARVGPSEAEFLSAYAGTDMSVPDYPAVQAAATAALAVHCAEVAGSGAPEQIWAAATQLRTSTLFGEFAVDPVTGAQQGHQMALVRWTKGRMTSP
jgi:hypothetical protein